MNEQEAARMVMMRAGFFSGSLTDPYQWTREVEVTQAEDPGRKMGMFRGRPTVCQRVTRIHDAWYSAGLVSDRHLPYWCADVGFPDPWAAVVYAETERWGL